MDDSSPDLSLKLRRRSSDSRDSFYMDFAQGIDSDIEEVGVLENVILEEDNGIQDEEDAVVQSADDDKEDLPPPPPSPPAPETVSQLLQHELEQQQSPSPPPEIPPLTSKTWPVEVEDVVVAIEDSEPEIKPCEAESLIEIPEDVPPGPSEQEAEPEAEESEVEPSVPLPSPATTKATIVSPERSSPLHDDTDDEHPISEEHPTTKAKSPPIVSRPASSAATSHYPTGSPVRSISHSPAPPSTSMGPTVVYPPPTPTPSAITPIPIHHTTPLGPLHPFPQAPQHLPAAAFVKRPSRLEQLQSEWRKLGTDALTTTLSALYGKLLVVMGIAFPIAEVISTHIPPTFYEAFYLYLYIGSIFFLIYMYALICHEKADVSKTKFKRSERSETSLSLDESDECEDAQDVESTTGTEGAYRHGTGSLAATTTTSAHHLHLQPHHHYFHHSHYGSFYLRMGAVAFGIGSMIYTGLEFGQYFELEPDNNCHNILVALTPATRLAFIFIQMYFIFLNNEQIGLTRQRAMARFGLMHMIGTNVSVWLNVLIQETKHEILTFYDLENNTFHLGHQNEPEVIGIIAGKQSIGSNSGYILQRTTRNLKGPQYIYECRRTNIMGSLVQDASPFLFPCIIEYSLICAAILYVMWKNISRVQISALYTSAGVTSTLLPHSPRLTPPVYKQRSPYLYSVDCARAHKGLFLGILVLVLTIISLILFFVLISRRELVVLAVMEVNLCELTLYAASTVATLIGMIQVRQLKYDGCRNLELDNILLIGAQTGLFIYSTFTIIGGHFTIEKNTILVLITALASLVETTCQTMFILDASRRSCVTADQIRRKPGRQLVTFLLVTNLAMWAINTLEKSRAESHPIQLHFYGLWAWTIITHVSMPLAIFYRFHSTVCLCEIWKRAYKMKPAFILSDSDQGTTTFAADMLSAYKAQRPSENNINLRSPIYEKEVKFR